MCMHVLHARARTCMGTWRHMPRSGTETTPRIFGGRKRFRTLTRGAKYGHSVVQQKSCPSFGVTQWHSGQIGGRKTNTGRFTVTGDGTRATPPRSTLSEPFGRDRSFELRDASDGPRGILWKPRLPRPSTRHTRFPRNFMARVVHPKPIVIAL